MRAVTKLFDKLEWLLKQISSCLMVVFMFLVFLQVFTRYFLNFPLSWTEQLARYLFIWMIMLYMPVLMRQKVNMSFDILLKRLPKNIQEIFFLFCELMIAVFAIMYLTSGIEFCTAFQEKILIGINIKAVYIYSAQIVGSGMLLLFTLEIMYYHFMEMIGKKRAEGGQTE